MHLFLDMLKAHGIENDNDYVTLTPAVNGETGFMIENWDVAAPNQNPHGDEGYPWLNLVLRTGDSYRADLLRETSYNWAFAQVIDLPGLPGQGIQDNPASMFADHVLTKIGELYYDVPYGKTYGSVAEWEHAVVAGYYKLNDTPTFFNETLIGRDLNGNENATDANVPVWRHVLRTNPQGNQINEGVGNY